ncbi:MAG: RimK/LysX family protein [Haloarculaceae archaeon]
MLSTHNSKETKAILNAVRELGHEPVWIRDENVTSWIEGGTVKLDPAVDVVINRLLLTKSDHLFEDLQLASLYGETAPVVNPPEAVQRTLHKYRASALLSAAGLPVPDAFFGRTPRTVEEWDDFLADSAVQKQTVGTNGRRMAIVSPEGSVSPTIGNEETYIQEFLDSGGERPTDVRAYVVDDAVVGAMRRHAPEGEWRTNVALGGEVADITDDLGARPRRLATEAAAVLGLDAAGVDLMSVDGDWYILEVNATAGFKGLFTATGRSVAPYIVQAAVDRAGGALAESRVREISDRLDDSVPDCKPPLDESSGDTLGYTTRVKLSGTDGVESTVAKSDTGAERTSIDTKLAGRIGAGPLVDTTEVRSAAGDGTETRPLVDVELYLNGGWRTVTASVTDRDKMSYPVLLGRDVLVDYTLEVSRTVEE